LGCLWVYREVRPESDFGRQFKVFKVCLEVDWA